MSWGLLAQPVGAVGEVGFLYPQRIHQSKEPVKVTPVTWATINVPIVGSGLTETGIMAA